MVTAFLMAQPSKATPLPQGANRPMRITEIINTFYEISLFGEKEVFA
jgi:hypothetical protein